MRKIKDLLKIEKNRDIAKILIVLIFYVVVFGIFQAGLNFQRIIQPRMPQKPEKIIEYNYRVIDNGVIKEIKFNDKKSITQVLDGIFNSNIEFKILRDGKKIDSLYGRKIIKLFVNNKEINPNLISDTNLQDGDIITINY